MARKGIAKNAKTATPTSKKISWERVNIWTSTLYTLIHSLHIAKSVSFAEKSSLHQNVQDSGRWINTDCSYNSVLISHPFGRRTIYFRRDPERHFEENIQQIIRMLLQDLVVIFDGMMDDILLSKGLIAGEYPQSKVEKLSTLLDQKYDWARQGCLELIAARNVFTHAGGRWNEKSINIVIGFMQPPPKIGEKLTIGVSMLFRYRKSMRTFLNEVA